jgi:hypothetical protein
MEKAPTPVLALATLAASVIAALPAAAQTARSPYQLSVFATAPAGSSLPDSIAVMRGHIFVGYGNGVAPNGSDGKSSTIVDYSLDGKIQYTYTVKGHNDGLRVDPRTRKLWAMQNQDANPNLVVIDPETHAAKPYSFGPTPHGGGFDDIVFTGCKAYFSASNPASNPNTGPAIVSATLDGNDLDVKPALLGTAMGIDIPTDKTMKLNLLDPDSMTVDPQGNIVLNSQSDNELIYVSNPGPKQRVLVLPLSYTTSTGTARIDVDDTAFVTSTQGFILFADEKLNKVFALKKNGFVPGQAYTSVSGAAFVGTIDLLTGLISPVVTGITAPGGMAFVDTAPHVRGMEQDVAGSVCGQESAYHEGGDQGGDQQGSLP